MLRYILWPACTVSISDCDVHVYDVSIVIPNYNRNDRLVECVGSVRKLVAEGLRVDLIIVDDGSDKFVDYDAVSAAGTGDGCDVRIFRRGANSGACACRNFGFRQARSKKISFLDSDDLLEPKGFAAAVDLIEVGEFDLVYGLVQIKSLSVEHGVEVMIGADYGLNKEEIAGYHWHTLGAVYTKDLLDLIGGWNVELEGSQDWELQARAKIFARSIGFLGQLMGYWVQHQDERIGTRSFRKAYTESVIKAAFSIDNSAKRMGIYDRGLGARLLKIAVLHAAQLGAHGFGRERQAALVRCSQLSLSRLPRIALAAYSALSNKFLDVLFLRILNRELLN